MRICLERTPRLTPWALLRSSGNPLASICDLIHGQSLIMFHLLSKAEFRPCADSDGKCRLCGGADNPANRRVFTAAQPQMGLLLLPFGFCFHALPTCCAIFKVHLKTLSVVSFLIRQPEVRYRILQGSRVPAADAEGIQYLVANPLPPKTSVMSPRTPRLSKSGLCWT
jgi:hypothetical protein